MSLAEFNQVVEFVREHTGFRGPITRVTSLQSEIGVFGDDMEYVLAAYAKRFGVDLTGYLWYFHTGEEGWNIGGLFFPPPNARVRSIPITVGMLHDFAQLGRWGVEYPKHEGPQSRPDILINQMLILVLILGFVGIALVAGVRECGP